MFYPQRIISLTIFLLLFLLPVSGWSQPIDFESQPSMPVDYKHADITLKFELGSKIIQGEVEYTFSVQQPRIDSLYLNVGRLDIQQVQLDQKSTDYRTKSDSLIIRLDSGLSYDGQISHTLRIQYTAEPIFGVHQTSNGVRFTSLLPMSTMHWLPVQDHPNNTFTVDYHFNLPKGWTAVTNGAAQQNNANWSIGKQIPANELAWVVGPMHQMETTVGVKKIRIFYPEQASGTESTVQEMLNQSYQSFQSVEREMGREFPFSSLNLVWLPDHRWETDGIAAGIGYIYGNDGDFELQVLDRLLGQWYGIQLRMNQWAESQGMQLYRASRLESLLPQFEIPSMKDVPDVKQQSLYQQQSLVSSIQWTQLWDSSYTKNHEEELVTFAVQQTQNKLLETENEVFTWTQLRDVWYKAIGAPELQPLKRPTWSTPDTITYDVHIKPRDTEPYVDIIFQATDSMYHELINVDAELTSFGEITEQSFSFTGKVDTVSLKTDGMPDNIQLNISDVPHNSVSRLHIYKPAGYWLVQLREGSTEDERIAAAHGLAQHVEESDLQLALDDALQKESSDTVKAAILSTLSKFTAGATGTAQTYLSYASSKNEALQLAAVRALADYPENESVPYRLQSLIRGSSSDAVRVAAIASYRAISDSETFSQFVQKTLTLETPPSVINAGLNQVFASGDTTAGTVLASERIQAKYPYPVRSKALQLLITYAPDAEGWEQRYKLLEQDSDPRIRFILVNATKQITLANPVERLKQIQSREYDERVLKAIETILKGEDVDQ